MSPGGDVRRALAAPREGAVGFFRGLGYVYRGAKLVYFEQPGLVRYWGVPVLVTTITLVASLTAVSLWGPSLASELWSNPSGEGWLAALARGFHWLYEALFTLLLGALALVFTLLTASLVAAPVNALLAEAIERRVTGLEPLPFSLRRALLDVLRTSVLEGGFFVVNVALFAAALLVPPASPALSALGLVVSAAYFAIAYVEFPLAARAATLGDRARFYASAKMALLGFGSGIGLLLFIPLVQLLFMPAAVAGAVLLHAQLTAQGASREDQ